MSHQVDLILAKNRTRVNPITNTWISPRSQLKVGRVLKAQIIQEMVAATMSITTKKRVMIKKMMLNIIRHSSKLKHRHNSKDKILKINPKDVSEQKYFFNENLKKALCDFDF